MPCSIISNRAATASVIAHAERIQQYDCYIIHAYAVRATPALEIMLSEISPSFSYINEARQEAYTAHTQCHHPGNKNENNSTTPNNHSHNN